MPKGTSWTIREYGAITGISYKYGGATRYAIQNIRNDANTPYNANLKYYDHFKQVFQTGITTNNTINISGASEKSDFNIAAANNHTVSPILKGDNGYIDRSNLSANVGSELFKGFTTPVDYPVGVYQKHHEARPRRYLFTI